MLIVKRINLYLYCLWITQNAVLSVVGDESAILVIPVTHVQGSVV